MNYEQIVQLTAIPYLPIGSFLPVVRHYEIYEITYVDENHKFVCTKLHSKTHNEELKFGSFIHSIKNLPKICADCTSINETRHFILVSDGSCIYFTTGLNCIPYYKKVIV